MTNGLRNLDQTGRSSDRKGCRWEWCWGWGRSVRSGGGGGSGVVRGGGRSVRVGVGLVV